MRIGFKIMKLMPLEEVLFFFLKGMKASVFLGEVEELKGKIVGNAC